MKGADGAVAEAYLFGGVVTSWKVFYALPPNVAKSVRFWKRSQSFAKQQPVIEDSGGYQSSAVVLNIP